MNHLCKHLLRVYFSLYGLLTGLLCLQSTTDGKAQSSHEIFEHLTTDHGLSSNKVEGILQDRDGFYWVATQNGLNRFDGTNFKVYRNDPRDSTSLTHNYCTALVEGANGDIWVATYKGVSRYIKSKGLFQTIYLQHPSKNFEIANRIYNLAKDKEGNIWIAGNGLWKYDIQKDIITESLKNETNPNGVFAQGLITRLVYDTLNHGLWLTSGTAFGFYDIAQSQFYSKHNNPKQWNVFASADGAEITMDTRNRLWYRDQKTQHLSCFDILQNKVTITGKKVNYGIKQINADDKDRIWIFYWLVGSEIFDPESETTNTTFFTNHHRRSMLSPQANALFVDKDQNYWIASGNGLTIYSHDNQYYKLHQVITDDNDPVQEPLKINAIAQTEPDHLWIATNHGLLKYNLILGDYIRVPLQAPTQNITTICADRNVVWIGVYDQLLCLDATTSTIIRKVQLNPGIYFIRKGSEHDLWVGFWTGGLCRMNKETSETKYFKRVKTSADSIKSNNLITGLLDGDSFWVGYNAGNGFSKYSLASNTFTHFHPQKNDLSNSNAGTVTVITKDHGKHLWLGTHGSGIFQFNPTTDTYISYQQQDGLNSNYINSIVVDQEENLWISTADGMDYLDPEKQSIRRLDMDLIFPDNDFVANGVHGLNDKLYFFCKNEFVEIDPLLYNTDVKEPQLVLSQFKIFDKEEPVLAWQEEIRLSHRQNFFSFVFSSIKTHPSRKVSFAYKLDGFDKDWIQAGQEQMASYTNVPEGSYHFRVKATNNEGLWSSKELSLPIVITPPFWRTWWFITLCVLVVVSAAWMLYQYRIHQLRRIFSIRSKISQDLHDDVGASLSSIHIYSSIAEKEIDKNPSKAKEVVHQINQNSKQVMESMSDIVWAMNAGTKNGASLAGRIKNYGYELLAQKNIACSYNIDSQADKKIEKPEARKNILLIVKEALNNIAKYSDASQAAIRVSLDGKVIRIQVEDNGKGFDPGMTGNGNGLRNMELRSASMGGTFRFSTAQGKGTLIECAIPITNISDT
ncbi:MAG TPA: two-component regulator propeller domain-containing protein [Saprospiraceae bacterium]